MNLNRRLQVGCIIIFILLYTLAGLDKLSIDDIEYMMSIFIVVGTVSWIGAKREDEED